MEKNENERKQDGKGREQEKIKIIVSFPSDLTRDRKFKKKIAKKIRKFKKIPLWLHFKPNQVRRG